MKLTPFAKVLIAIFIIAGAAAAAWHLGLRDLVGGGGETAGAGETATPGGPVTPGGPTTPGVAPGGGVTTPGGGGTKVVPPAGAIGTAASPLKVSIVSFHGYAPALLANGNSLKTQPGSIYANLGVNVEFVVQDDIPTLTTIFESGTAQCAWRTSDFWAQEQPNLRNNKLDARAIVIVDNTQGADAVIARDPAIKSVEDLAGRSFALLQYTPSHGMVIDAIENSSLTARKRTTVSFVNINADEGTAGVRAAFESGNADAAALWDPDLSLALLAVPGAHVIYSTKTATNLIFDVIVCDKRALDQPANERAFQGFVKGWMDGVVEARANPDKAVDALVATEQFFALLTQNKGRPFVKGLFANLVWTGIEDNARILGLAGDTNHYERVYRRFDGIYRTAGALANPNSPVVNPSDSFDYRFVKALIAQAPAQVAEKAQEPQFTFTQAEAQKVATTTPAALTRPVTVNFATGSAELNKRGMATIDTEMVPIVENNGSAYFEVSGNTDSTGARSENLRLSEKRARSVVDYLVKQWEFPAERFVVKGYGPDRPICNERTPEADGLSLEECRAANRTTRIAILAR